MKGKVKRIELKCDRSSCDHVLGLKGQTFKVPYPSALLGDPPAIRIGVESLRNWRQQWGTHFLAVEVDETSEVFWWDIDELPAVAQEIEPGIFSVLLSTASEYDFPLERPFDYPSHLSPLETPSWDGSSDWLRTRKTVRGCRGSFRKGWHEWGNLHPSGLRSEPVNGPSGKKIPPKPVPGQLGLFGGSL